MELPTIADVRAARARPETELEAFARRESRITIRDGSEQAADFIANTDHQSAIKGFDPFQTPEHHDDKTRFSLPD